MLICLLTVTAPHKLAGFGTCYHVQLLCTCISPMRFTQSNDAKSRHTYSAQVLKPTKAARSNRVGNLLGPDLEASGSPQAGPDRRGTSCRGTGGDAVTIIHAAAIRHVLLLEGEPLHQVAGRQALQGPPVAGNLHTRQRLTQLSSTTADNESSV